MHAFEHKSRPFLSEFILKDSPNDSSRYQALQFASDAVKDDREVVMAAVNEGGSVNNLHIPLRTTTIFAET